MVIFNSYVKLPEGKSHQPSLHAMSPSSCPCPMGKSHGKYPWPSPGSAKKISGSMLIIELYINLSHTHVYPLKSTHTYQYVVTSYGAVLKRWVPLNHPFYFRIFHQKKSSYCHGTLPCQEIIDLLKASVVSTLLFSWVHLRWKFMLRISIGHLTHQISHENLNFTSTNVKFDMI